jgi:hypothetical protein
MKIYRVTDERLAPEGQELDNKIYKALKPIFDEAISKGAVIREVSHMVMLASLDLEMENILSVIEKDKNVDI